MNKIISFSLWGSNPKYLRGSLRNAELALRHYPGWKCRFYVADDVARPHREELASRPDCEVVLRPADGWRGLFWRFLPAMDPSVDIFISRDCDSRLSEREAAAVRAWEASDSSVHIMRDHPAHNAAMLGGMWGAKRGAIADFGMLFDEAKPEAYWQSDQDFLVKYIYPRIKAAALVHDEFFGGRAFPTKRRGLEFVGQVFTPDDRSSVPDQWRLGRALLLQRSKRALRSLLLLTTSSKLKKC